MKKWLCNRGDLSQGRQFTTIKKNDFTISAYLKFGLKRRAVFGGSGLIRGAAFGGSGLIRGAAFGGSGLIRGAVFGGSGLITGGLLY